VPTLDSVISRAAMSAPNAIAIREWNGQEMSYQQLDLAVHRFASWLHSNKVLDADSVAIHLPNCAAFFIGQFGSFRAAAVATYVNFRLAYLEAKRQLIVSNAKVIITTESKAKELRNDPDFNHMLIVSNSTSHSQFPTLQDIVSTDLPPLLPNIGKEDSDALIRFTSGSTGEPKGLIVTHRSWMLRAMALLSEEMRMNPNSTTLVLGQVSHQAGLFVIPTFLQHSTLVVMEKFDLKQITELLSSIEVSTVQIVPTMFSLILNDTAASEAFAKANIVRVIYGGSPIRPALLDQAMKLMPTTEFVQSYGSHEAGSISYLNSADHHDAKFRQSAGRLFLPVEVRLHEPNEDGVGEIEVKNPWLPSARLTSQGREAITEEWTRTGDLGMLVGEHLYLNDRLNDLIITGGFNVYPAEVENIICAHHQILDCAVSSAPDDIWGEKVIAFVVLKKSKEYDEISLREHCKSLLASYKVPKEFRVIEHLPLNANSKPDRRKLSNDLWAGYSRRIN